MALTKPGFVSFSNVPILKSTSITRKIMSGDKEVFTNLEGLSGFSDGPLTAEFDVKMAVPDARSGGYEFDAAGHMIAHRDVTLTFTIAGWAEEVEGRVIDDSVETSAENPTAQSFSFKGKLVSRVRAS